MMKKSILSLIAGAIVALASCSQTDEMPVQPQEGEQLATFTIQTPAVTRADVTQSLSRFIVEAYEGSSVTGTPAARVEAATGTLTLGLKKNTEYTFVFWADKGTAKDESAGRASNGYWDPADLKAVKVTFGRESVKGEVAYCLAKTFNSKDFEANKTVTLRNATAQVNFVEAAGLSAADNTLTVTYSAGATLNVGTGKVTEVSEAITHIFINIGQVSAGATLATDYILAPKGEQQMLDLTLKLNTEDPKSVTNVPFEQCFITNIKGEYTTQPTTADFTFTITADDTWETPDNDVPLVQVGAYYYDDETYSTTFDNTKTCIGIVYEVNADGKSGKIVGLTQTGTQDSKKWSEENVETGATNTTDGRANMATIAALIANSNGSKSWDNYPAFKWVTEQNNNTGNWDATNDKWYLPAKDEFSALYTAYDTYGKDDFNTKLTTAGGIKFNNYYYLSSTESSSNYSWYTSFSGSGTGVSEKINNYVVRCIRVFECHKAD